MSVDKIIIENFKIFEGQHIFDLKDMNIFTGPNNSGKSTLMKAIALFSSGLKKSDFPTINLPESNAGEFKKLINNKSKGDSFKIGFYIELGEKNTPYKVLYEFVAYENGILAPFASIEVFDPEDILLLAIYNREIYTVTEENVEYELVDNIKTRSFPYRTPADGTDESQLMVRVNVNRLEVYLSQNSKKKLRPIISHLKSIQGNQGNWWLEAFMEYNFNYDLENLRMDDLLRDIQLDKVYNLGGFEIRDLLYHDLEYVLEGDNLELEKFYERGKKKLRYDVMISEFFQPIFLGIAEGLEIFKERNYSHITFQNFSQRLILKNATNAYLFRLLPKIEYGDNGVNYFVRQSLKIFDIDGFVSLMPHINSALEINLVTGLNKADEIKKIKMLEDPDSPRNPFNKNEAYDPRDSFITYDEKYSNMPKQNIVDLGKGTANLIGLILKTFTVLQENEDSKNRHNKSNKALGKKVIRMPKKLILVEEPEAFLHPNWQSKLTDFFLYCMKYSRKFDVTFMIETHSEYLIRKLQYLTAKGEISSDDSIIYYFQNPDTISGDEIHRKQLIIRPDGLMDEDFGKGFFDESTRLTWELLSLQNKN